MASIQHIATMYKRCWLKTCDGKSITLGYEMRQPADYPLLEKAIQDCASKHTTSQGAHVAASCHGSWGNGNSNGFDVTFEAAPIQGGLGAIKRPFTHSEINMFANALKNAGCIQETTRISIERAVKQLAPKKGFVI